MKDYKFNFKHWLADIAFLLGSIVLWYANSLAHAFFVGSFSGAVRAAIIIAVSVVLGFLCYTLAKAFKVWRGCAGYMYWLSVCTGIIALGFGPVSLIFSEQTENIIFYMMMCMALYPYLAIGVAVVFFGYKFIRGQMDRKPDRLRR